MSSSNAKLLLFGDATDDPATALETATEISYTSSAVRNFLDVAFDTLKDEAESFFPGELDGIESFYDMLDPADQSQQSTQLCQIAAVVLISITRIAALIL
jgi:hypothetical protein